MYSLQTHVYEVFTERIEFNSSVTRFSLFVCLFFVALVFPPGGLAECHASFLRNVSKNLKPAHFHSAK